MNGKIYVDGKVLCEAEIETPTSICTDGEKDLHHIEIPFPKEVTLTFESMMTPWSFIWLITGKWPTNNWLRMNGGIMMRRVQMDRAKKLMKRKHK